MVPLTEILITRVPPTVVGEREDFLEEPDDLWGSFKVLLPEE